MQDMGDVERIGRSLLDAAESDRRARVADGVRRYGWAPDAWCPVCGDTGVFPLSDVPHEQCAAGQRVLVERRARRAQSRNETLVAASGLPPRFLGWRLATTPAAPAARDSVAAWCGEGPTRSGRNLIVAGPVGSGKTGLAVGAMFALWAAAPTLPQRFVGAPALMDRLRPGGDLASLDDLIDAGVLVVDDLAAEKASEFTQERLYVLLNGRYEGMRPTIITTNADRAGLLAAVGERVVSRLLEDATVVRVRGDDARKGRR